MNMHQFKLMALIAAAMGLTPKARTFGNGQMRAAERLADKRKRNQEVYGKLPPEPPSRQVSRAAARAILKRERSALKAAAMQNMVRGGAAVVT